MPLRIEDYALIGDCESAALVGRDGSIDWLCWPRFDSDACFAALLGDASHGRWLIAPAGDHGRVTRRYRDNTLILETRFETESGAATLIDFIPIRDGRTDLIRLVVGERGTVKMHTELVIRFGYGKTVPWVTRAPNGALRAISGPDMLVLRTPVALQGKDLKTVAEFAVHEGQSVPFGLSYSPSHLDPPPPVDPWQTLAETERFWTDWAGRCQPSGPYDQAVIRSVITLKALTFAPTGGLVAAPTTSLPEQLGGPRNWDYRYCWLRDATLTLLSIMSSGYYEEAHAWRDWLLRAAAGSPEQIQIMYGIGGEHRLMEWEVPWLPGYEKSAPVRIGNAASGQLQLDVYGEVMDALYQARRGGLPADEFGWNLQRAMVTHLGKIWREPDEGIWEVRGPRRHFTHSKVMAWVAFDRIIKSAETFNLPGDVANWKRTRAEIRDDVLANGFDPDLGSFVQAYGSRQLDASLLLLPAVGFLPPHDARVRGTVEAIERDLTQDGLVRRYDPQVSDDGLPGDEGVFLACSFWLADALVLLGRTEDARRLFERLLVLRNDVGLLSEEYDTSRRRLVGNFPQAFSHVGLINTAANLARAQKPAAVRSEQKEPTDA